MDYFQARRFVWLGLVFGVGAWAVLARLTTPMHLTLLTGPEGSSSYQDGLRYESLLERRGLDVEIEVTDGAVDNLIRLAHEGGAAATFAELGLEGSVDDPSLVEHLRSLGSLYLQPIWLFVRRDMEGEDVRALRGRRFILGTSGSATRVMAEAVLEANGVGHLVETQSFEGMDPGEGAVALVAGRVDAMFALGEPVSPAIAALLAEPTLRPWSFRRAAAYDRRYETLEQLSVPEGALDLARNLPAEELHLLGVPVQLVVPSRIHPAIVDLLLEVSWRVHRRATLFSERGAFPRPAPVSLPLNVQAERFFEEGGPRPLYRHLPFWLASWLYRMGLILVALCGAVMAVVQLVPPMLGLRFSMPMNRLYGRLEQLERSLTVGDLDRAEALEVLAQIERESLDLKVSMGSMRAPFFEFRQNIHDLRDRLDG